MKKTNTGKQDILIVFLGNIAYDSRVRNFHASLSAAGHTVKVVGFDWLTDGFTTRRGDISVYKLTKGKFSLLFYLAFAGILWYRLLFTKADIIFAEDVYTLPFAVLAAWLKRKKVFYDSREVYSALAGLSGKQRVQRALVAIEKFSFPHVTVTMTTGHMDSAHIERTYNLPPTMVVRNLPLFADVKTGYDFRARFGLKPETKIILYQGVILPGRGMELLFDILPELPDCVLVVVGGGEAREKYAEIAADKKLTRRVFFFGKVPQEDLLHYTAGADIGTALIENLSLSYYYALPNKMFECIMAGKPVIVSNFPQMQDIVDRYGVGLSVDPENREEVIAAFTTMLTDSKLYGHMHNNCKVAARELNWENEVQQVLDAVTRIGKVS